jgi:hypothetical protein
MTKEYLERLEPLLQPVARALPANVELAIKRFFSGAAAYAKGRICTTLTTAGHAGGIVRCGWPGGGTGRFRLN